MPALESMACGVPVIAPDAAAGAEITRPLGLNAKPGGYYIQHDMCCARPLPDFTEVLTLIFKVIRDREGKYPAKAAELAKGYNWDGIVEAWKQVLLSVPRNGNGVYQI
jgi:glycosyltransferase involved in cell wall biosynthesis